MKFDQNKFKEFANSVASNMNDMFNENIFRTDVSGDEMWEMYLNSFPQGTNEIFRERTFHDDNTDRSFIKRVGNIVVIQNGTLRTIWDVITEYPYNIVSENLSKLVKSRKIVSIFRTNELNAGGNDNIEMIDNIPHTWNHFYSPIPKPFKTNDSQKEIGEYNKKISVYKRGLEELSSYSISSVLDLILSDNLYKGSEWKEQIKKLKKDQESYNKCKNEKERNIFLWSQKPIPIKNSSIGSLMEDITKGDDIENAVRKYESKVAPQNYKRSKSIITQKMVEDAFKTIDKLDLRNALERRHAKMNDITINNVLWADRTEKKNLKNGDKLMEEMFKVSKKKEENLDSAENISIDNFLKNILPKTSEMEMFVKNKHTNNFVSIIAPVNENSGNLFKWNNDFSWNYNGNITDSSISQKVKNAGGNINAHLRVSLNWFNKDDLDIHCTCPDGHIYFGNKQNILDVDMNVSNPVRDAVENLAWNFPKNGKYKIWINNFTFRESMDCGFIVELENNGITQQFVYDKPVSSDVNVIEFNVKDNIVSDIKILNSDIQSDTMKKEVWNIETENFVKVKTVMFSPNHWDENKTGNKHFIFILDNCKNDDEPRGIYNEFLRDELYEHRKVFEILADKTKCENSNEQLSGLGFSETKRNSVVVKVTGNNFKKLYNINF